MIKINLADRKRSATAATNAGTRTGVGTLSNIDVRDLRGALNSLGELPLKKVLIPLVVALAASYSLDGYQQSELDKLNQEYQKIIAEKPTLEAEIAKMKDYEVIKASTEKDEFAIRSKLQVIRELINGRGTTPRILDGLSRLTPPEIWLTEFHLKEVDPALSASSQTAQTAAAGTSMTAPEMEPRRYEVNIHGMSENFGKLSPFLEALNDNQYFQGRKLTLKDSQTTKDDHGREMVQFEFVPEVHGQ